MKTCPYCKESVHDEAIKCRFCHSMLLPVQAAEVQSSQKLPHEDDGRVTYVLDRDLIRFGKFSIAILAMFLIVGAYLFGFKLESALERVNDSQEKMKIAQEKLTTAQRELEAAQGTVRTLKADVEAVLAAAKTSLSIILVQQNLAVDATNSIRNLTPQQQAALPAVKEQQSDKAGEGKGHYWVAGATLRIRFLDGNARQQAAVKRAVAEWSRFANLKFEFVLSGHAEVRVSFKQQGSWSYLGTNALAIPPDQPTMNLQFFDDRTALHEFGHALGLIEEHQNPSAKIKWNRELVISVMSGPPNLWPKETIEASIFSIAPREEIGAYREFDPDSVMTMTMPAEWTGGIALGNSTRLSESDKALIARIYPKER